MAIIGLLRKEYVLVLTQAIFRCRIVSFGVIARPAPMRYTTRFPSLNDENSAVVPES